MVGSDLMMDVPKGNAAAARAFLLAGRLDGIRAVAWWKLVTIGLAFPMALLAVSSLQPRSFYAAGSMERFWALNVWSLHLPMFLLLIGLLAMQWGRLRAADLGLARRGLPALIVAPALAWAGSQLVLAIMSGGAFVGVQAAEIPSFAANLLATGLNEESFFRGFLFVQIALLLRQRLVRSNMAALVMGGLLSALWFAIAHFQFALPSFAAIMVGGLVGCLLYARTANLWFVIGLHGLFNAPLSLFAVDEMTAKLVVLGWMLALAAAYPWLRGMMETRKAAA